jgi:putative nucleotidyltransferase with HDIG domain
MAMPHSSEASAIVTKALARVGDIATLPEVTLRIISIVDDPQSTARDLHVVIKNDPALSTKVLKVVNSAFYGLSGQIASVDRAIILMGLSAVKNIAIASSIAQIFKGSKIAGDFSANDLWRHSVAVGVAGRSLAIHAGRRAESEEVFLAGLLHDLGMLVERQAFPDQMAQIISRAQMGEDCYLECERQVFSADHQLFGAALATKWKFPRHLRAVTGYHHDCHRVSEDMRQFVALIQTADILCCQERLGFYLTAAGAAITPELLAAARLKPDMVAATRDTLQEDTTAAEAMLKGE